MDESGTTVVFRVENQHCAAWGVAVADLHRTDPPVYVQDRDGGSWKPFLDRVSVACVEMVLSEVVTGRGPSGDMCELPGGLIAMAESAYEQMAVPEYRLWADPGITVRWFSAPGKLLRMDGRGPRCRLLAGGQTLADLEAIRVYVRTYENNVDSMLLRRVACEPSHLSRNAVSSAAGGERAQSADIRDRRVVRVAVPRRARMGVIENIGGGWARP